VCDREASTMRRPWSTRGLSRHGVGVKLCIILQRPGTVLVFGIQIITPGLRTPSICVLPSPKRTSFRAHMKRHVKMGEIAL